MTQPTGSTMNFLIHDANGQPQMIKVPTSGRNIMRGDQIIKTVRLGQSETESPIVRTIRLQSAKTGSHQLVNLPVRTLSPEESEPSCSSNVFIKEESLDEDIGQYQIEHEIVSPLHLQSSPEMMSSPRYTPQSTPTSIYSSLGSSKKRPSDSEHGGSHKRSRGDKASKGLRHFSMKVCEKVRNKGITTYNEVADELVQEFSETQNNSSSEQYDQKNIRRRVYDALNVLMAMNIISKEKKEIKWLGLPTNSLQESLNLNKERRQLIQRINEKTQHLHELLLQQISIKKLIQKNMEKERLNGEPPVPGSAIELPFLIVSTNKKTVIDCSLSNDKTEYLFVFDDKFEINEDFEILKRMRLGMGLDRGDWTEEELAEAKTMVASCMEKYINQMAYNDGFLAEVDEDPLDEEGDNTQITYETVMPEEALSISSGADSDLSSDLDHVEMH